MAIFSSKTFYDPTQILSYRRHPLSKMICFACPALLCLYGNALYHFRLFLAMRNHICLQAFFEQSFKYNAYDTCEYPIPANSVWFRCVYNILKYLRVKKDDLKVIKRYCRIIQINKKGLLKESLKEAMPKHYRLKRGESIVA